MKLTPSKGQDMMIWFRPENRSIAFTVYYHFILPVPGTGLELFIQKKLRVIFDVQQYGRKCPGK